MIYDISSGLANIKSTQSRISSLLRISYDEILSSESDGHLTIWNINTGQKIKEFNERNQVFPHYQLAQFPNGIIAHAFDGGVKFWNLTDTNKPIKIKQLDNVISTVVVLSDTNFATSDNKGTIKLWDYGSDESYYFMQSSNPINALICLPNYVFISGLSNGAVVMFNRILTSNEIISTPEILYTPFYSTSNIIQNFI